MLQHLPNVVKHPFGKRKQLIMCCNRMRTISSSVFERNGASMAHSSALWDVVLQADIKGEQNQRMMELFPNQFVQDHLPDLDNQYQWLAAETCKPVKGSLA